MACNESAQEVNVKATFFGPNMDIRPEHPPQTDENTAHVVSQFPLCPSDDDPWDFDQVNCKSPGSLYEDLEHIDSPHVLDKFFSTLTSRAGRLAIDVAYLGNESEAQSVADAVIQQHKILRAHAFGTTGRLWYNATDGSQADSMTSTPGTISVQANITTTTARIRLVQDAVSTRVLEGLLTSILILSLLSWYTMPSTKLLPRDPCSIASVVALLADGDILDLLPPNAQQMTDKELEKLFSRGTFHMQTDEGGRLGIRYKDA
ncbi:hypothetical protein F4821DRAFT_264471 [Hypoxylon rubiginosum]|uniref:Uncharacterized protein n=1 Tax=Hypoxylon rubiginosum TaxID=110542 RepID=A0ACC0CNB4_9PEZI|nr:hypothetical protein F4821DRAFT_264471 [Hypoxylon rubiginosum]